MHQLLRGAATLALLVATFSLRAGAEPAGVTWNNVTLGAPVASLRPVLGDPLRVIAPGDGSLRVGRYWLPGSDATFFLIVEKRGYVQAFHAFTVDAPSDVVATIPADPSGVRVGDTLDTVKTAHPDFHAQTAEDGTQQWAGRIAQSQATVVYEFANGRVHSFHWEIPSDPALPASALLADPAGDAPASSVLDTQKTETPGVRFEYLYLGFHPCDAQTRWKLKRQALVNAGGRAYDRFDVICPTTQRERSFFFDITGYFGKM